MSVVLVPLLGKLYCEFALPLMSVDLVPRVGGVGHQHFPGPHAMTMMMMMMIMMMMVMMMMMMIMMMMMMMMMMLMMAWPFILLK